MWEQETRSGLESYTLNLEWYIIDQHVNTQDSINSTGYDWVYV